MKELQKVKYNFGAGPHKIEGYKSVDVQAWKGATDIMWDLTQVPYEFAGEQVDEIISIEFLEHISWRDTEKVLREWCRILKLGGKLRIQVPDCGKMMDMYVNDEVCDCVPHKVNRMEDFKAKSTCWTCGGKAKVNPRRWLFAFTGAQKHPWDFHRNIFTKERLEELLKKVGFRRVSFEDDIYKLVVICLK